MPGIRCSRLLLRLLFGLAPISAWLVGTVSAARPPLAGSAGEDYTKFDFHLVVRGSGPGWPSPECNGDFARGNGFCTGKFTGSTGPFGTGVGGTIDWETPLRASTKADFQEAGLQPRDQEIAIRVIVTSSREAGKKLTCLLRDRGSGDCYTRAGEAGKPAGSQGGPLRINAHAGPSFCIGSACEVYVEMSGYCPKRSRLCSF